MLAIGYSWSCNPIVEETFTFEWELDAGLRNTSVSKSDDLETEVFLNPASIS